MASCVWLSEYRIFIIIQQNYAASTHVIQNHGNVNVRNIELGETEHKN
jgi:hypothetical protein